MSGRSSFVLYMTSKRIVDKLSDEQAGVLFKRIFAYVNGDDLPEMDPFVDLAFTMFQEYLDADYKKYQEKVERAQKNGARGGRPKKEKPKTKKEARPDIPYEEIVSNYNRIISRKQCPGIAKAEDVISDQRKKRITARLETYTIEDLYKVFEKAADSDWMSGRTGRNGPKFGLDWMLRPENFVKILEGNYDNNDPSDPDPGGGGDPDYGDYVEQLFADEYL